MYVRHSVTSCDRVLWQLPISPSLLIDLIIYIICQATLSNCNLLTITLIDIFNMFYLTLSFIFAGPVHRFP